MRFMIRGLFSDDGITCPSAYTREPAGGSARDAAGNSAYSRFIHWDMKIRHALPAGAAFFVLLLAGALCAPRASAQAPAGPIQQSPDALPPPRPPVHVEKQEQEPGRKDIQGFWKFNRDESDDARRKIQEAESKRDSGGPNVGPGGYPGQYPGGYPGGGYPRGPFPFPGGNGPYGGPGQGGNSGEIDQRMLTLLPPDSVTLKKEESDVELTDDKYRRLVFYTDGRKIEKSKDDRLQSAAAHWDGDRLVSDEQSPQSAKLKMSRTFELSSDGRQLEETLRIDQPKSNTPLVIRYVFDAAKPD